MNLTLRAKVAFGMVVSIGVALLLAGWFILHVLSRLSLDTTPTSVNFIRTEIGVALVAAFLLAALLSWGIARSLTRPLAEMTALAQQLTRGGLGHRITASSGDEVGQLAGVLNQITDQLQTKIHEVSEDRAQLLAMLTAMAEGVMVLDPDGRVLQINPALERMFALHAQPSRNRRYTELIRHEALTTVIEGVLASRTSTQTEIQVPPGPRTLRVEASVAGGSRPQEACAVLVVHDMTDIRRLESVRKDFVANVSHELRTPLTSIRGYVEALQDGGKDDPEMTNQFLGIIATQGERLNLILDDLLQLSRIESGQMTFRRDPVDVRTVLARSVAIVQPLADKKQHRLVMRTCETLPLILGDEDRLVQVVTNLLDNAIKYTPDGGTVSAEVLLSAGHARAPVTPGSAPRPHSGDSAGSAEAVDIVVTDTGFGIPEADRPRVFERFYRVDKARSRELGGTGLGLAIVKHLVEQHGGQVWVEGNQPKGSRFIVRIPKA
ncbi:MAG: ATP-binding protein [Nitrospiraceae bacterium]